MATCAGRWGRLSVLRRPGSRLQCLHLASLCGDGRGLRHTCAGGVCLCLFFFFWLTSFCYLKSGRKNQQMSVSSALMVIEIVIGSSLTFV